jgi:hypothetical protein
MSTHPISLTRRSVPALGLAGGLGRSVEVYTASCRGATFGEALAVRGEEAADSRASLDTWLQRVGLSRR